VPSSFSLAALSLTFTRDKLRFDALQAATAARGSGQPGGGGFALAEELRHRDPQQLHRRLIGCLPDAGDRLYKAAKARLYAIVDLGPAPALMDASKARVLQTKRKRAPSTNGDDECADGACESESAAQRADAHMTGHPGLDALEVVERYAPGKMPPSRAAPHAEPAKKQLAVPYR